MSGVETGKAVTVVIPNWNGRKWLPGCLAALREQTFQSFSVVVVDNGSTDGSLEGVRAKHPDVRVLAMGCNAGFAAAVNEGIRQAETPYVALLNTDAYPRPRWLAALVSVMAETGPDVGCLASRMLDMSSPDLIENAGDRFTWQGANLKRGHGEPATGFSTPCDVLTACAGAALYRREFLAETGGFDERFFAYLEDIDLGLRGRILGYRCLFVPEAEALHQGHGSGMAGGAYVRAITRNRLLVLSKNVPAPLLRRHWRELAYGQMYFFVVHRRPLQALRGYLEFLRLSGYARACRRDLWRRARLSPAAFEALLDTRGGLPPLRRLVMRKLGSSRSGAA